MKETTRQIIGQAVLESLEDRRMMSAVNTVGETVVLQGNARANNKLSVALDPGGKTMFVRANKVSAHIPIESVKSIRVIGGEGDDRVTIDPALTKCAYVRTGAGDDFISTGGGNDTVLAGHGRDTVHTNGGDDFINDGPGADSVKAGNGDDPRSVGPRTGSSYKTAVKSFTLVDSETNKVIGILKNGATINLATIGARHLNVKANLSGKGTAGSVRFSYDGVDLQTENAAPYALASDKSGDFKNWDPRVGTHTLTATPYSGKDATGVAGTSSTITFSVIDDAESDVKNPVGNDDKPDNKPDPKPDPNPNPDPKPDPNPNPNPDPKPDPNPDPNPDPKPDDNTSTVNRPVAKITVLQSTINAGQSVHVNGLTSELKTGDVLGAKFEWNFGDDTAKYNTLTGFNAAHAYDRAGTYTVTLKVTNSAGKSAFVTTKVTVKAAERRFVYVSNNGDDTNTGTSSTQAVKTFARAAHLVGDNTEVLFERGDTFNVTSGMSVGFKNVYVGAYGTGAKPVLKYTGALKMGMVMIAANANSNGVTIRGLSFDSKYTSGYEGMPAAVSAGGKNITVRENEFGNVSDAINSNKLPTGVLAVDNTAKGGIRGYFAWVQGSDHVYLGNTVGDSQYQHVIRSAGVSRMLISHNDFTQKTPVDGIIKGTLNLHKGEYYYITNNTLHDGVFALGPLGGGDGVADKAGRLKWAVVENNTIHSPMKIDHGAEHVMVRNNVVDLDGGPAFEVGGYSKTYARGVVDLYVVHNTVVNNSSKGNFIKVGGHVDGITMTNNLYVAPNLCPGEYSTAAVNVCDTSLTSFRKIADNIWPAAEGTTYAEGGVNFVGTKMSSSGYRDPKEWEAMAQVQNDKFQNVTIGSTYLVSFGGITAGANLKAA